MRPSGRPFVTSRALRSPVDAGSIPYSAVTQPRPLPAIQRGTDSWTEAVQMTRVSPQEISTEPVAVATKPGWIVTGRSSPAARPSRARAGHAATAPPTELLSRTCSTSPSGSCRKRVPCARKRPGSPVQRKP